jgi:hypothetical protein
VLRSRLQALQKLKLMLSILRRKKIRCSGYRVMIFKNKLNLHFFQLESKSYTFRTTLEKIVTLTKGLKVLENALHVSAMSAENSAYAGERKERALVQLAWWKM